MPLYALIYLFLFILFAFGSTYMHFEEGRGIKFIIAEAISYCFMIFFLVLYYEAEKFSVNSLIILAMLIYSFYWEYFSYKKDIKIAKSNFEIRDKEIMVYSLVAIVFMSPVYFAAFALIF